MEAKNKRKEYLKISDDILNLKIAKVRKYSSAHRLYRNGIRLHDGNYGGTKSS
jgi:hypothetical protein